MSSAPGNLPDLLGLIPEGDAKLVLCYCFDTLQLSVEETEKVIYAASKLISSIDWLLRGASYNSTDSQQSS